MASNGVVHVIDKVLIPPEQTIKEFISKETQLDLLHGIYDKMNQSLISLFERRDTAYTWFLPSSKAIESHLKGMGMTSQSIKTHHDGKEIKRRDTTATEGAKIADNEPQAIRVIEDCLWSHFIDSPLVLTSDVPREGLTLRKETDKQSGLTILMKGTGFGGEGGLGGDLEYMIKEYESKLVKTNRITVNGVVHVVDRVFCK